MTASYDLSAQVVQVVEQATAAQVGLGTVPAERPDLPYAIVDPAGKATPAGDMASLVANRDIRFSIRMYGETVQQVQWMADKIEAAMLRATSTFGAQWVLPEASGAIVPDGSELYSCVSTFCIRT